jgi:uncharacterized protein (TIGR03435 family)
VLDKTGLTGRFDFDLTFSGDPALNGHNAPSDDTQTAPGLFSAIQEQLGLKLEVKAPAEILIIDHAEKPSPS